MSISKIFERFKQWGCNTVLAVWWHRYAPSWTVRKRFFNSYVYMNFRDNIDDISKTRSQLERREKYILEFPKLIDELIWDVGANVGLFSVRAAQLGRRCVAFELSQKACHLMTLTKSKNNLDFQIVARPLAIAPYAYLPPDSASAENQTYFIPSGKHKAISYLEAATLYGVPSLIKMDIEGGELEFFNCGEFKTWLLDNSIAWLVEVHPKIIGSIPLWDDVSYSLIGDSHYLYCKDRKLIDRLKIALTTNNSKTN